MTNFLIKSSAVFALAAATLVVACWLVVFLRKRRKEGSEALVRLLPEPRALPVVVSVFAAAGVTLLAGKEVGWGIVEPVWISVFSGAFLSGLLKEPLKERKTKHRAGVTAVYTGIVSACLAAAPVAGLTL
jgi:amino acid transporter